MSYGRSEEQYTVDYTCTNCGAVSQKYFDKGRLAPDDVTCNKCKCRTAVKSGWNK